MTEIRSIGLGVIPPPPRGVSQKALLDKFVVRAAADLIADFEQAGSGMSENRRQQIRILKSCLQYGPGENLIVEATESKLYPESVAGIFQGFHLDLYDALSIVIKDRAGTVHKIAVDQDAPSFVPIISEVEDDGLGVNITYHSSKHEESSAGIVGFNADDIPSELPNGGGRHEYDHSDPDCGDGRPVWIEPELEDYRYRAASHASFNEEPQSLFITIKRQFA